MGPAAISCRARPFGQVAVRARRVGGGGPTPAAVAGQAWMTSTRTNAPGESQPAQDWFCPYCAGPYFQ